MATRRSYIDIPDHARRDFVKWSVGIGAALGLQPWKVFEVQESIFGAAFAQSAGTAKTNRMVSLTAGNGGLAWFTQLFPFVAIAADTANANVSYYKPGVFTAQKVDATKGDQPLSLGADAPAILKDAASPMKVTSFICGANETHTGAPTSLLKISGTNSLYAASAAIQTASPTLVPAITVGTLPFGTAPGAPSIASVPNAQAIAGLFKSVAASAGNALEKPENAALFEAYFKANVAMQKAAGRATQTRTLLTAKAAANLLGKQLDLAATAADFTAYGVDDATLAANGSTANKAKLVEIASVLIQAMKAYKQNLTSMVMGRAMNDDPHGAFTNMPLLEGTVKSLGGIFQAFLADAMATPDPLEPTKKIGENLVFTITGDTFKNPTNRNGWGDGTPQGSSVMYVMHGGKTIAAGQFGGITAAGASVSFIGSTGAAKPGATAADHLAAVTPANAAVLYAVSKHDSTRVKDFNTAATLDTYKALLNPDAVGV